MLYGTYVVTFIKVVMSLISCDEYSAGVSLSFLEFEICQLNVKKKRSIVMRSEITGSHGYKTMHEQHTPVPLITSIS